MSDEIVNRVANSGLVNFDLEAYYLKDNANSLTQDWLLKV